MKSILPLLSLAIAAILSGGCASTPKPVAISVAPAQAHLHIDGDVVLENPTGQTLNRHRTHFVEATACGHAAVNLRIDYKHGAWRITTQDTKWAAGWVDTSVQPQHDRGIISILLPSDNSEVLQKNLEAPGPGGIFDLGWAHFKGAGAPQNLPEARRLFNKAATQGHEKGAMLYAYMLACGLGGPMDRAEANKWYQPKVAPKIEPARPVTTSKIETASVPLPPITDEELANLQDATKKLLNNIPVANSKKKAKK